MSNWNREKERQTAKECLKTRAKKLKLVSDKSHADACVGTIVHISVPEVERGKGLELFYMMLWKETVKDFSS